MKQVTFIEELAARGIRFTDLAKTVGVHKATAMRWAKRRVPAERVREIETATGIPAHAIRPDLFRKRERRAS